MTDLDTIITADALDYLRILEPESVHAIITDPPYGVSYQSNWREDKSEWKPRIANDDEPFTAWLPDAARLLTTPGCLVCFCRWDVQETFRVAIEDAGLTVKSQIIWDKVGHGMGDLLGEFGPQHEVAWFAVRGRYTFPGARPTTIIRNARVPAEALRHPNEKPLGLMWQLIEALTRPGETILDPFAGSGVVCHAAAALKRHFIGIEIDEGYADVARARIPGLDPHGAVDVGQGSLF